jgi:hypothetical protein
MRCIILESSGEVERMREGRGIAEAVFMKFVDNSRFHATHAFCFYEGEDGKYYDPRIRMKFKDRFFTYVVGNKKEVLKLLEKINRDGTYTHVCMMFFVDRDCDNSRWGTDENLFETPCYSIENLYACEECFKKILQSEFAINECDNDFGKCLSDFHARMNEFHNIVLEFNALLFYRRSQSDSNSNFVFGSVKTAHLANIRMNCVKQATHYKQEINDIKSQLNVSEQALESMKQALQARGDFCNLFRGKNQLDFFCTIIRALKALNKSYFDKPLKCVHINITNNRLSELSQYATTPPRLHAFLDTHLQQLHSSEI